MHGTNMTNNMDYANTKMTTVANSYHAITSMTTRVVLTPKMLLHYMVGSKSTPLFLFTVFLSLIHILVIFFFWFLLLAILIYIY